MDLILLTVVSQVTYLFPSSVKIAYILKRNSQVKRLLMIILALKFTRKVASAQLPSKSSRHFY